MALNNMQLIKGQGVISKKADFSWGGPTNEFLRNCFSSF
jgi:hypothetical protein